MKNILIIGAGQLGSRHLQGAVKSRIGLNITVVDVSIDALETAKARVNEIIIGNEVTKVEFCQKVLSGGIYDLCIIATTSNVRFMVFQELVEICTIKNIIFEKVLFQKEDEYIKTKELLASNNIKGWVNCPRRAFPVYKYVKSLLESEEYLSLKVKGASWGLACNAVHFIDLFAYLTGKTSYNLDCSLLNKTAIKAKRDGFFEVNGVIQGDDEYKNTFELDCRAGPLASLRVSITTPNFEITFGETNGELSIVKNGEEEKKLFRLPYQSETTFLHIEEVISSGVSSLTDFSESCAIHLPFIRALKEYFEKSLKMQLDGCPIT